MSLETKYLGLKLRNPVVASAGPLQQTLDGVKSIADGGVGAIVMYSLMEEQIRAEQARQIAVEANHDDSFAEALSYFPNVPIKGPDTDPASSGYLRLLEQAAKAVDIPVIGSLNGATMGGWISFAKRMQDAGASALELNVYYVPGNIRIPSEEVENLHLEVLVGVKDAVSIPVAVKLAPYFSSFGEMAPTVSCSSTGSSSRTSTWSRSSSSPTSSCRRSSRDGCRARGSPRCTGGSAPRWPAPRVSTRARTSSSTCSPGPTWS
jgi:dihydroorotate dehydrogenase (fumarate)